MAVTDDLDLIVEIRIIALPRPPYCGCSNLGDLT
jgi:hypothetical protein